MSPPITTNAIHNHYLTLRLFSLVLLLGQIQRLARAQLQKPSRDALAHDLGFPLQPHLVGVALCISSIDTYFDRQIV